MKRDMELIRTLLINAENDVYQYGETAKVDGVDPKVCAYHVKLMIEAGLVDGHVTKSSSCPYVLARIDGLTNAGHDFLDRIKQDVLWRKALDRAAGYGLDILIQYIQQQASILILGAR